jgi:membrane peptidoglycan carboxypeptidase
LSNPDSPHAYRRDRVPRSGYGWADGASRAGSRQGQGAAAARRGQIRDGRPDGGGWREGGAGGGWREGGAGAAGRTRAPGGAPREGAPRQELGWETGSSRRGAARPPARQLGGTVARGRPGGRPAGRELPARELSESTLARLQAYRSGGGRYDLRGHQAPGAGGWKGRSGEDRGYRLPGGRGGNGRGGGWDAGGWDAGPGGYGHGQGRRAARRPSGERGARPRRKGDWWRHWTWKKALTVAACAAGTLIVLGAAGIAYAYSKTPIPNVQAAALNEASTVYFSNGQPVGHFGTTDRQPLQYSQIPPLVRNAVVAAEDKNFWHEGGISVTGILRAAWYDLTSSGGNLQGGSTITQQLVRNYYVGIGTQQTISRKIKEIFVAEKLAKVEPKSWILTQYLNTVYFGDGAYGIGAAAQAYFGVQPTQLSRLTPAQAAMLAAMIQSPSYYSPNPKAGAAYQGLVYRWHYVLGAMVKAGWLSPRVAAEQKFPQVAHGGNSNSWGGYRGYIMNRVRYELETVYGYTWNQIQDDGLHVYTTVSQNLTRSLYATVRHNEALMRQDSPPNGVAPGVTPDGLPRYVRLGALLEDPANGAILAEYGGPNYLKDQFDNALQSRNQVGSSFKPYVLATAVKLGMNVLSSKLNGYSPLWIPPDWEPDTKASLTKPANPAGWYEVVNDEVSNPNRPVTVTQATAMSLNTAYTDLWHRVAVSNGQYNVVNMAKAFGVDTQASGLWAMRNEAGTALGQASLTVAEQAGMIATLADLGVYHSQHMISKIEITDPVTGATRVIPAKVVTYRVLTPAQAADVDYAMSFDTSPMGTAPGMGLTNGQTVIAKTGTTNLAQSAFFLGATQRDAMAIGMFVNRPGCTLPASEQSFCTSTSALSYAPPKGLQTLFGVGGEAGYGGQWPAIIWHDYFMKNFNSLPPQAWPPVNNDGSPWNLAIAPPPPPKPRHQQHQPKPPHCPGHSRHCGPNPTPTPTPTPTPSPTPTCLPTGCVGGGPARTVAAVHPAGAPRVAGAAGGAAFVAVAVAVAAVPSLPAARRRRARRRQR